MKTLNTVNDAIEAAVHDINLLRLLVKANDAGEVGVILRAYCRAYGLTLSSGGIDLNTLYNLLQSGHATLKAEDLVRYYDNLMPPEPPREEIKIREWVS